MNGLQIVTNRIDGAKVESRTRDGREWLVAPVVMLCEGVLNGELVSAEEFSHHAASWNGRPVMLGHPMADGAPVSANAPETLARLGVGQVFATVADGGKLKAQLWLDMERAGQSKDGREVVRRLRSVQPLEVSTAYWRDLEEAPGSFNGATYDGIAHNLKPDHLAILLHDVGACSLEDGCGCPRINMQINQHTGIVVVLMIPQEIAMQIAIGGGEPAEGLHLTLAYLGDLDDPHNANLDREALRSLVSAFANDQKPVTGTLGGIGQFPTIEGAGRPTYTHLDAVRLPGLRQALVQSLSWGEFAVAHTHGFTPHVTLGYMADMPEMVEARPVTVNVLTLKIGDERFDFPLRGQGNVGINAEEEGDMLTGTMAAGDSLEGANDAGHESGLIQALKRWAGAITTFVMEGKMDEKRQAILDSGAPFDAEALGALSDEQAEWLAGQLVQAAPDAEPAANEADPEPAEPVVPEAIDIKALLNAELADLGGLAGLKAKLAEIQANVAEEKAEIVARLVGNKRCAFSEAQLNELEVEMLEVLEASLRPADYRGQGGGPQSNAETTEKVEWATLADMEVK